jgi:hypothetical protein
MNFEALVTFHIDTLREGPGSGESTREAMGRVPAMPLSQPAAGAQKPKPVKKCSAALAVTTNIRY